MTLLSLSARRRLLPAVVALSLLAGPAGAQLPNMGDAGELSSAAERRLGERVARELYRDPDYIDDPVLVEYVQGIWQPLLAAARQRGELTTELDQRFAWQVLMGKDRTINAFAVPGGWLGLNMGLISVSQNRDEVASVLAHELSHVTQRHISRMMEQEKQQSPLMLAAMILGALAVSKSPQAASAMVMGSQALAAQNQLKFSRDMEREADRVGLGVMKQAGFQPAGFVSMFEKLQQAARLNDNGMYPYLRTHPMTTERIAEMQSRQQLDTQASPPPTLEHAMAAARARVFSNPNVDALRAMEAEAEASNFGTLPRARQAGVLYAAAMAADKLREPATFARLVPRLDKVVAGDAPAERLARLLVAEVAMAHDDTATVLRLVSLDTPRRPEMLLAAQALVKAGRPAEAAQKLQLWVATQPRDATAWQQLGQAYVAEGQALRAVRAEAESQVAELDYAAALDRLKAAQDMVRRGQGDHIEASIIDTRARVVASLLREQALER